MGVGCADSVGLGVGVMIVMLIKDPGVILAVGTAVTNAGAAVGFAVGVEAGAAVGVKS